MEKNKTINKVVGASFEEMNKEDMMQIQGAGDVDVETTVTIVTTVGPAIVPIITKNLID